MNPSRPNFDWITDELAVGGCFDPKQTESLAREHGIRAVVDLRNEDVDDVLLLRRHGIALLHLPTEDMCGVDAAHLDEGVRFASSRLDRGERVLVHCQHGIGRSAVLALCVLVQRGHEPLRALSLMKDRRDRVSPSPAQFACWLQWLESHRPAHAASWTLPDFDAFKAIAYRHLLRPSP
jgi:protein-tyrosine phosphatase